jgi:uncharacterized protein YbaP (TraB family)
MFQLRKFVTLAAFAGALWVAQPALAEGPAATPRTAPAEAATTEAPRPGLWMLADDDTRIYLFGTVHILPPELRWRSAGLDRAVAQADELVLEVAEDPRAGEVPEIEQIMLLDKSQPILERVSPERRDSLRQIIEGLNLSVDRFDRIQTWAAAMTISVAALLQSYGGDAGKIEEMPGVEDALRADFIRLGRPISGVETGPQQLGFLASLGPETQQAMLDQLVDSYRAGDTDLGEPNEAAWVSGDVQSIATEFDDMPAELFDVLISRRNAAWTDWLIHRLERPGTVLFAVGAGHLAGDHSVQEMLAARGFRVTRLN